MDNVVNFLIAFAFVLLFALPGDIYWFLKKRNFVPSCDAEAKEYKNDKKVLITVNIVAIIVTILIACVVWVF